MNNLHVFKLFVNKAWNDLKKLPYFINSCAVFILLGLAFLCITSLIIGVFVGVSVSNKIITILLSLILIVFSFFSALWAKNHWTNAKKVLKSKK
jgi:ABC-type protease/lipase transport system fused ATPase/permease subunit